ncbi:heterokaryon incompatibility protein-domain-containing protein [Lasiosphaeria hispida]|uniref:Heterokaryon incompatibility protein-domain-containing protein n=1 Tax=Lasiosphaeria hispida TaxID=260671 RepID=A0AAJ0H546_9PEZI|nr:heterokaryon incompatibility protein-domain-containing protein [Lasiosphaeria hispida]
MRLIERIRDGKLRLTGDLTKDFPQYAILSHTWGADTEEVTFDDMVNGTGQDKPGYQKIKFCAEQAERDGLQYSWVDTCCIDKRSSTELAEAINSMFRWYQQATRCYVYLSDLPASRVPKHVWEPVFRKSRWFTRGWTLQELLAPLSVEFFAQGRRLGDKHSLVREIHEITGVAIPALQGCNLSRFSIEERFEWAAARQTSKEEDWAYCLLGIFGVFIPPIYGEGKAHAAHRLREEITKVASRHQSRHYQSTVGR